MATVITAKPTLDKTSYAPGDKVTITIPGATAMSSTSSVQKLAMTLTAADGTTTSVAADVPVLTTRSLAVKITAVNLGGVAGTVAADGLSATVTAV